jgi:hypothetical protein
MLHKRTLWYADWETRDGKRHRLGFKTKKKALRYQALRRAEVAEEKKVQAARNSRHSPRLGPRRKAATAITRSSSRKRIRRRRVTPPSQISTPTSATA